MSADTRVLLIEDDPGDAQLVRRQLREGGFELEIANRLADGLGCLEAGEFDVVLLDLHLPDTQGPDTVRTLRKHHDALPLVVFTTVGDETTALQVLDAGAHDYVVKGEVSGEMLTRAIRYAMERHRLQSENEGLQRDLVQLGKRESLSVLASGLVEEFKGLLDTIATSAAAAERLPEARTESLARIQSAADYALRMTSELDLYLGCDTTRRRPLNLAEEVAELVETLRSLVEPTVRFEFASSSDCPPIEAAADQIRQLARSLIVNAIDSIEDDPSASIDISVDTREVTASESPVLAGGGELAPGRYVCLCVRDTGCGMDEATASKALDPFFTTKDTGRGLGLSVTLGTVLAHGGGLSIESAPRRGSLIVAYLPASTSSP